MGNRPHNAAMKNMNMVGRAGLCGLLAASALLLGGCVVAPAHTHSYESEEVVYGPTTSVYVRVAPPAPRIEYRSYPPAVGYIWIDGYWNWGGVSYAWVPGRWVAPRPGYVWVPHRWDRDGDRWRQNGGRWEQSGRATYPHRERDADDRDRDRDRYRGADRPPAAQPRPVAPPQAQNPAPRAEPRQPDSRWQHGGQYEEPRDPRRAVVPRSETSTPSERSHRDPRDPYRKERQDDWRKDKEKDKDRDD